MKQNIILILMDNIVDEIAAGFSEPVKQHSTVPVFRSSTDPREEHRTNYRITEDSWVRYPMSQVLADHMASLRKEPPIPPGTPDPYVPLAWSRAVGSVSIRDALYACCP